jgi:N-acetylneuraminic acid mutarotase
MVVGSRKQGWIGLTAAVALVSLMAGGCSDATSGTTGAGGRGTTTVPAGQTAGAEGAWTELTPAGEVPPARGGHALVCDPASGRVILFGGMDIEDDGTGTYFDDTWAYDPAQSTWTELDSSRSGPAPRTSHCMAYESSGGLIVLFGGATMGADGNLTCLDDTWAYDPGANTWTELDPAGTRPSSRSGASMAYDPTSRRLILFGGSPAPEESESLDLGDTWTYDPSADSWAELRPAGPVPPARSNASMVYEPSGARLLLFGGQAFREDGTARYLDDTWAYDPSANAWTELAPSAGLVPSARSFHSMVYEPVGGRLMLFGGMDETYLFSDTWAYEPRSNIWTELMPNGWSGPDPRAYSPMVYEPESGRVILFGGMTFDADGGLVFAGDTWAYVPERAR